MPTHRKEYKSRPEKLKQFSKRSVYAKLRPSEIAKKIPDNYITENGYTKAQLMRDVYKLHDCNNVISYIDQTVKTENGIETRLKQFDSSQCNIFTCCSICAEKIGRRRKAKYADTIKQLSTIYPYIYMITFTTRDEPTFNRAYDNLTEAVRKYVLMGQLRGHDTDGEQIRSSGEASKIKAMALAKEITIGKNSGLWHVHAHAIAFCDQEIDYKIYDREKRTAITEAIKAEKKRAPNKQELKEAVLNWKDIEIIDQDGEIKSISVPCSKASMEWIKATEGLSCNIKFNRMSGTPEKIFEQCNEVLKYTSKVSDFETRHFIEILANRKHKRFFATYGELYNVKDDTNSKDIEEIENNNLYGYTWNNKDEKLVLMDNEQRKHLELKYSKKTQYYKAKSIMMKAYYVKEEIKDIIVDNYNKNYLGNVTRLENMLSVLKPGKMKDVIKKEYDTLITDSNVKSMYINRIDDLENTYIIYKKLVFKLCMGLRVYDNDRLNFRGMSIDEKEFYSKTKGFLLDCKEN